MIVRYVKLMKFLDVMRSTYDASQDRVGAIGLRESASDLVRDFIQPFVDMFKEAILLLIIDY